MKRKIELLSPAKNLETGIAAIEHGADAVYIGAPMFGARSSAGNSIEDIAKLVNYAHLFDVKIYVTLNTILYDNELPKAVEIIQQLYKINVDAVIIQDLGLLECDLPPIALHASTQLNNRTPEKVKFLEDVGFEQVVLARELNLNQIKEIANKTNVELEYFVHGALCVCYNGQCYMSEYATGRSGNRGECAQMCRHKYSIEGDDFDKNKEAYYLSTQDLHLGNYIGQLIDAGINSFKIEGRLKDDNYVKNVTAYFRKIIDKEIAIREQTERASKGSTQIKFEPDIYKTFSRGFTNYYIEQRRNKIANTISPKSKGEYIGTIKKCYGNTIELNSDKKISNGDGLCYIDNNELLGIRANSVNGNQISLTNNIKIKISTEIWRNYSIEFEKELSQSHNCRKLAIDIEIGESQNGFYLQMTCENGQSVKIEKEQKIEIARNTESATRNIKSQLSKLGDSIFYAHKINIKFNEIPFIVASELNEARRIATQQLIEKIIESYKKTEYNIQTNNIPYPKNEPTDFRLNIANEKCAKFFEHHGINQESQTEAFELNHDNKNPLMTTKYCIRYQMGVCSQITKRKATPIILSDKQHKFRVEFDCNKCEMNIHSTK